METRAAHLLFNARIPGYKLLELMRSARLKTEGGLQGGRVDNPVAYYFGALEGLIDEWRERSGYPPRRRAGASGAPGGGKQPAAGREAALPAAGTDLASAASAASAREAALRGYALWANALARLEPRLPAAQFDRYVRDARAEAYDEAAGVLRVSAVFEDHLAALGGPLADLVQDAVREAAGRTVRVEFVAPPARSRRATRPHHVRWPQAGPPPPEEEETAVDVSRPDERSHHVA